MKQAKNLLMLCFVLITTSILTPNNTQAEKMRVYFNLYNADHDAYLTYDTNSGTLIGGTIGYLEAIDEFMYPDAAFRDFSNNTFYVLTAGKVNGNWVNLTGHYDIVNQWPPNE